MGTEALLRAAGVGSGDEVVVPAYGSAAVAEAVVSVGAMPVFADIDPATYCLSVDAVDAVRTERTAAVVAVRRFGNQAAMPQMHALGQRHGMLVLEEGEQGATYDDVARRRTHAAYLTARLSGVHPPAGGENHSYQQYVVRVPGNGRPDRDAFARVLRAKGVDCRVPVKTPLHRTPQFWRDVDLPETERAVDETLALPVDAWLSRRDLQRIVSACNALGGLLQPAF
ncbi:DegT/DnrJ/EryC1/StrS family aminotransferase [Streptomyces spectabilis]|uniref:DegT/DnrJ/EryC1/StrS aminotransferase n=1 Tax=Streptomyces spectabilis TaxID=68270 RepID=A0A516REG5_STRST|nr:DegT/DnrJ/EryC1/StrS family aminotransferase [Streptomyces spectabilis]QDQ14038.1 DegT/DnrJ/EryC1/StrS aminotransferase [Streptomyces spectabilis]